MSYMSKYIANRRKKLRNDFIKQLGGKCVVCGDTNKLEFDHIDRKSKLFSINRMFEKKLTLQNEEIKKCQLLCKKHHDEKTLLENGGEATHGSLSRYCSSKYKCRCELCKKAAHDHWAIYKLTHKRIR